MGVANDIKIFCEHHHIQEYGPKHKKLKDGSKIRTQGEPKSEQLTKSSEITCSTGESNLSGASGSKSILNHLQVLILEGGKNLDRFL